MAQVKIWGILDIILQHSQYALVAMPSSFVISPNMYVPEQGCKYLGLAS